MAVNATCTILQNKQIARDVYLLRLQGPTHTLTAPGRFVNLHIDGFYLRRPISVCDWDDEGMTLIYKVLGKGTARLAAYAPGQTLDALVGLGRGFDVQPAAGRAVVLAGGGVGVPPLYGLAKALLAQGGAAPAVALGFADAADVFYAKEFEALGCAVHIATESGAVGTKGYVTQLLAELEYDYYYACGPQAMLRAVHEMGAQKGARGQLSFEERMGCGFGACMGCSCQTASGPKRVCLEGPVFDSEEVFV